VSTPINPLDNLTPQQRSFVEAYCISFNGKKAAIEAGYSLKTARQQASRLLTSVNVQAGIKHLLGEAITPEEIAARWQRLATASIEDFYTKVQVEHTPRIRKPLAKVVAEYRKEMEFEEEVAIQSEALITNKKEREKFRKVERRRMLHRERHLLRLEMELQRNPDAFRMVDGPVEWREEMQLDLAKAESLGVLDLMKSVTTGPRGTSFTFRDQDAAMENLAKWRGMQTTKVDLTSKGESMAPTYDPAELAKKLSPELLAAYRSVHETLSNG
jgi:phage terminase small subunit